MSRFERAIEVLVQCGLPLFDRMKAEGKAYPMSLDTANAVKHYAPPGIRRKVYSAVRLLTDSRRYLEACSAPDAQRWNLAGEATGPVRPSHRAWAVAKLEEMAAKAAERERERAASYQTDPKWAERIRSGG